MGVFFNFPVFLTKYVGNYVDSSNTSLFLQYLNKPQSFFFHSVIFSIIGAFIMSNIL